MFWHSLPPEMNTALLMSGAGVEPMLQAAAGWEALATAMDGQAGELRALLGSLQEAWTGSSSDRAIAAITPMITWLQDVSETSRRRGLQAAAQAASYTKALAMTPSLPEIASNHVTHAVLSATNFLGINLVPIGMNETDYFVRMWNQAGTVMDVYQAETAANTFFEPVEPMKPMVNAGVGEFVEAAAMSRVRASAIRPAGADGDGGDDPAPDGEPGGQKLMEYLGEAALLSAPLQQMLQQISQPLQQLASMSSHAGGLGGGHLAGGLGAGAHPAPVGLVGAHAFSNHPLAGGTGRSVGKGLMFAEALPGAGGSSSRTPLIDGLLGKGATGMTPAAAGAGSSTMGGAAPMGAAAGAGGAGSAAGLRSSLLAPTATARSDDDDADSPEDDDW